MIITGGSLRGRRIASPAGSAIRPTPARVKEAIFSILAPRLEGARVLDCFAGTGALGIESLSRGAQFVTFIDAHSPTAQALKATLKQFAIDPRQYAVIARRAEQAVPHLLAPFDIVFADPPYAHAPPMPLFIGLHQRAALADNALIIYEHAADAPAFDPTPFRIHRREKWGEVGATFLAL